MTSFRTRTRALAAALLLFGACAAAGPLAAAEEEKPRSIEWLSYREAVNKGRDEDRPVLLHFTADWCGWCKKMKRETYRDMRVIRFMHEKMSAGMIDTEVHQSLARKYSVSSLPTLWFLDADGRPLTAVPGYVGADKLLRIMEYIATKAYEEVDYDTWLDRKKKS
jgi:thioredoxin-related protein